MNLFELDTYIKHSKIVAMIAIIICILAWAVDLSGIVYVCPYCRVQRSVIGILGLILLSPFAYHWIGKYSALVVGFFGAVVGANQHFMGWKKISSGEFVFKFPLDPFLLSGIALTMIIGLMYIIMVKRR